MPNSRSARAGYTILSLFTVLLLAACDGDGRMPGIEAAPLSEPAPGTATETAAESGLLALPRPAGQNEVGVRLHEYEIDMTRDSVAAGDLRFHVLNAGTTSHMFIVRNADTYFATPHLVPGDSTLLEVSLEPGEYRVICAIRDEYDHISEGMRGTLLVR
ncbi:MAG TPA: hypothetical protein VMN39_02925 [Longimicrobiaceae bacterium]|nr:hypothetical protein [Longimicrobiaceae bacterium]